MPERTDGAWKEAVVASTYLEGVRGAIPLAQEQIDVMLRLAAATGAPLRRFLDLGCGDGVLGAALLERFPEATGVLADFSGTMLDAARKRLAGHGAAVEFIEADYGIPSWVATVAGAPFDVIVSGYSIHHQPDTRKREVYREVFDLLAPGGVFVNIEHVAATSPWVAALHDELFIDNLQARHTGMSRKEVAETYYLRGDKTANLLTPVETQCAWLRELGYTDVDCFVKIFELAVFGGRKPQA
jgi:ubiquinone/menaquinone biosynthesis C-methylase UbiE